MSYTTKTRSAIGIWVGAFLLLPVLGFTAYSIYRSSKNIDPFSSHVVSTSPWRNVGGCGAGGSGGGGGGAKWVGMGVSGGLLDVQVMYGHSFGQNFFNNTVTTRLSVKPRYDTQIGLSIPVTSKIGEVQPSSLWDPEYYATGGTGDIALDLSRSLGMSGQYSLNLGLTLPTGQYDIKRGADKEQILLPTSLQKGGGVYNASLGIGYTKDVEDGIWLFDLTYSHPFNMKLFSGENEFNEDYFQTYADSFPNNDRFFYRFKPYGESDLGDYVPKSLSASAYFGYKGIHGYVHSWGLTFSAPLEVGWIRWERIDDPLNYKPRPDPDHQAWSATLNWGVEAGHDKFPLFFAVSLPIHDRGAPNSERMVTVDGKEMPIKEAYLLEPFNTSNYAAWDPPDWKDFGQQWTISIGVKATLF